MASTTTHFQKGGLSDWMAVNRLNFITMTLRCEGWRRDGTLGSASVLLLPMIGRAAASVLGVCWDEYHQSSPEHSIRLALALRTVIGPPSASLIVV
jgi:hypothetical protein